MSPKSLYALTASGCVAGYAWVFVSEFWHGPVIWKGCLFKQIYSIPCPACGSTRSILLLLHGDFWGALALNPLGLLLAAALILLPMWLLIDAVRRTQSFYRFFVRFDEVMRKPQLLLPFAGVIATNWIWNIVKGL
ncbi:MAG: DUF2752 domain-containing protein [Prevotellaceae bacterium]|jgi:hypothetical protein|nr:DUF2752 domain-containing protein [Prevotellaceae bacterium]